MGLFRRFWHGKGRCDSIEQASHTVSTTHISCTPHATCNSLLVNIIYRHQDENTQAGGGHTQLHVRCCTRVTDVIRVLDELHLVDSAIATAKTAQPLQQSNAARSIMCNNNVQYDQSKSHTAEGNVKTKQNEHSFFWVDIHGVPDGTDYSLRQLWEYLGVHPDTVQRLVYGRAHVQHGNYSRTDNEDSRGNSAGAQEDVGEYAQHAHFYDADASQRTYDDMDLVPTTDEVRLLPLRTRSGMADGSLPHSAPDSSCINALDELPYYVDMQLTTILEPHTRHGSVHYSNSRAHELNGRYDKRSSSGSDNSHDDNSFCARGREYDCAAKRASGGAIPAYPVCEVCDITCGLPCHIRSTIMTAAAAAAAEKKQQCNTMCAGLCEQETECRRAGPDATQNAHEDDVSHSIIQQADDDDGVHADCMSHATHIANTHILCFAGGCVTWCRNSCTAAHQRACLQREQADHTKQKDEEACAHGSMDAMRVGKNGSVLLFYRHEDHGRVSTQQPAPPETTDNMPTTLPAYEQESTANTRTSTMTPVTKPNFSQPSFHPIDQSSNACCSASHCRHNEGGVWNSNDTSSPSFQILPATARNNEANDAQESKQRQYGERLSLPLRGSHVKGWRALQEAVLTHLIADTLPQGQSFATADFVQLLISAVCHAFIPEMNYVLGEIDTMDCIMSMIVPEEDSDQADMLRRGMLLRQKIARIRHLISRKIHVLQMLDKPAMRTLAAFMCKPKKSDYSSNNSLYARRDSGVNNVRQANAHTDCSLTWSNSPTQKSTVLQSSVNASVNTVTCGYKISLFRDCNDDNKSDDEAGLHSTDTAAEGVLSTACSGPAAKLLNEADHWMQDIHNNHEFLAHLINALDSASQALANISLIYISAVTSRSARVCLCSDAHMISLQYALIMTLPFNLISGHWSMNCLVPWNDVPSVTPFWCLVGIQFFLAFCTLIYPATLYISGKYNLPL